MTTIQNNKTDEDVLDESLNDLLNKANEKNEAMENDSIIFNNKLKGTENEIDQNIKEVREGLSDLDKDEQETEGAMEKLMLEEAEDIAKDDAEDEEN
jgi:hypothetical protein